MNKKLLFLVILIAPAVLLGGLFAVFGGEITSNNTLAKTSNIPAKSPWVTATVVEQKYSTEKNGVKNQEADTSLNHADSAVSSGHSDSNLPKKPNQIAALVKSESPSRLWDSQEHWQADDQAFQFKSNLTEIENLQVGQSIAITLPNESENLVALINETRNGLGGSHIFIASVTNFREDGRVTIVRGEESTYFTIATKNDTFGARVNNNTAETKLWREIGDESQHDGEPDFILAAPKEISPPEDL